MNDPISVLVPAGAGSMPNWARLVGWVIGLPRICALTRWVEPKSDTRKGMVSDRWEITDLYVTWGANGYGSQLRIQSLGPFPIGRSEGAA